MRLNIIVRLNNCNCHDIKCDAFNHYKQAKRAFLDAQRSAIDEYESANAQKIENDIEVDQTSIWTVLNKRKQRPHTCTALMKDGTLFTDSIDVMSICTPVQTDDISILATDRQSSQFIVKICEEYSIRWSIAFSAGINQLLNFGKPTTGTDVRLYNEPIST
ncbi:Hypothetical predicted protein, partial [Mytilus galloprovincialis]